MIRHGTAPYLECSSKGDRRFSAFSARLRCFGNHSIEELYQAVKVFPTEDGGTIAGLSWRNAKGKPCLNPVQARVFYSQLWDLYIAENPDLVSVLAAASGLSDIFGQVGHACQADELWRIRGAALRKESAMREDLIPKSFIGLLDHVEEECAEVVVEIGKALKAAAKLRRFGYRATDPKTQITYDNVADLKAELMDARAAIDRLLGRLDDPLPATMTITMQGDAP